jgi:hypothetical protein
MISIVGLERYYGTKRSEQLEGPIQSLFRELDGHLATLRRSGVVKAFRAGAQPDNAQMADAAASAELARQTSDALKRELYALVRCFVREDVNKNLCQ